MDRRHRPRKRHNLALVIILTIGLLTAIIGTVTASDPYEYTETTAYWVEPGDTLWKIARKYSNPRQDVRQVIALIEELNDCTATIYPGDYLRIPVF